MIMLKGALCNLKWNQLGSLEWLSIDWLIIDAFGGLNQILTSIRTTRLKNCLKTNEALKTFCYFMVLKMWKLSYFNMNSLLKLHFCVAWIRKNCVDWTDHCLGTIDFFTQNLFCGTWILCLSSDQKVEYKGVWDIPCFCVWRPPNVVRITKKFHLIKDDSGHLENSTVLWARE